MKFFTLNHSESPPALHYPLPDPVAPVNSPWWQPAPRSPSFDLSALAALARETELEIQALLAMSKVNSKGILAICQELEGCTELDNKGLGNKGSDNKGLDANGLDDKGLDN